MSKNFIMYNGRISFCQSNVAKMNIVEYIYYKRFILLEDIITVHAATCDLLIAVVTLAVSPIIFPFHAYRVIKDAKRAVAAEANG